MEPPPPGKRGFPPASLSDGPLLLFCGRGTHTWWAGVRESGGRAGREMGGGAAGTAAPFDARVCGSLRRQRLSRLPVQEKQNGTVLQESAHQAARRQRDALIHVPIQTRVRSPRPSPTEQSRRSTIQQHQRHATRRTIRPRGHHGQSAWRRQMGREGCIKWAKSAIIPGCRERLHLSALQKGVQISPGAEDTRPAGSRAEEVWRRLAAASTEDPAVRRVRPSVCRPRGPVAACGGQAHVPGR
mmetsp:Transcript_10522/g.25522  ORF Transcript_10522/g.25522 Transcript_10522/m.25522 type:complete len:242 (-) Transcript_10522:469-1194(-)